MYLLFLKPILNEVNSVNLLFQGDNIDLYSGYEHLMLLSMSICSKFVKPEFLEYDVENMNIIISNKNNYLDLNDIDDGIECSEELRLLPSTSR